MTFHAGHTTLILVLLSWEGVFALDICGDAVASTREGVLELTNPWSQTIDGCQCNFTTAQQEVEEQHGFDLHFRSMLNVVDGSAACAPTLVFRNYNTSQIFHACPSSGVVEQNVWVRQGHTFSISLVNIDGTEMTGTTVQLELTFRASGMDPVSVTCTAGVPGSIEAMVFVGLSVEEPVDDDVIEIGEDKAAIISLVLIVLIVLIIFVVAYFKWRYDHRKVEERNREKRLKSSRRPVDGSVNAAYQSYGDLRTPNGGLASTPSYGSQQPITSPLYNDQNGLIGPAPLYPDHLTSRLYGSEPAHWISPHQTGGRAFRGDPNAARRMAEGATPRSQRSLASTTDGGYLDSSYSANYGAPHDYYSGQPNGRSGHQGPNVPRDSPYREEPVKYNLGKSDSQDTLV